jgi:hypothetical protein
MGMKVVNNIGKVFYKYSFITHALNAISAIGMVALAPLLGYLPIQAYACLTLFLAGLGIAGSFISQQVEDYEEDLEEKQEKAKRKKRGQDV